MPRTATRRRGSRTAFAPQANNEEPEEQTEEERPSSRRGRRGSETSSRRRSEENPDTDTSKRSKGARSGWGAFDEEKAKTSDFGEDYKPSETQSLIKFLDAEPFATFSQHWIERGKGKKKSFTCLSDGCPLCDDLGDRPRTITCFNVIDLSDPDNPETKVWPVGIRVASDLRTKSQDSKTGPLDRDDVYFAVSRSQSGKTWNTSIVPVKVRDLQEDWDCEPLTSEEIEQYFEDGKDEDYVETTTAKELREIVEEVDGYDD